MCRRLIHDAVIELGRFATDAYVPRDSLSAESIESPCENYEKHVIDKTTMTQSLVPVFSPYKI